MHLFKNGQNNGQNNASMQMHNYPKPSYNGH